ncbi:MAG: 2,3-bisphosphoglycerate-independent phosphoglycerate mutase [Parcubacteria group bacterium GW2011_GWA2_38_13]|nr:MAG: 2,3-bisphosphoglycerate-independent phosphoglycerate mutase [Parcubacteria group bacterium GW2011_GWA2_38_13]
MENKRIQINSGPMVLLILDGWGISKMNRGNAIALARKPYIDHLMKHYPNTKLNTSGKYVGLPPEQAGNSEAGHMNIGAGRIMEQDAVRVNKAISQGSFFRNPALISAINHVKKNNSNLHIMGLVSSGQSAHSEPDHLLALISLAKFNDVKNIYFHLFTDGRDSPSHSALKIIEHLERILRQKKIATIIGRYYAMDRKKNWSCTEKAYNALVLGIGRRAQSPQAAITQAYNRGETDEFIEPYVMTNHHKAISAINDNDAIIFFNLRSDRARQLAKPFVQEKFEKLNAGSFKRKKVLKNICFVAMTNFGPDLGHIATAFPVEPIQDTLPMLLIEKKQLYIAETEKYAHMTYFINGGYADPVANETRIKIESPNVKNYAETPRMSVGKITTKVLENIPKYDFIGINFSSPDMIGHTGNIEATIKAIEFVDTCIGRIYKKVLQNNGILIITADHGNAEHKINLKTDEHIPEHSKNPVPFILISKKKYVIKKRVGSLCDVLPTILELFNIPKADDITGVSLIK